MINTNTRLHLLTLWLLFFSWLLLAFHQYLSISQQFAASQSFYPGLTILMPWLLSWVLFFVVTFLPLPIYYASSRFIYRLGKSRDVSARQANQLDNQARGNPVPLLIFTLLSGITWQIILFYQPSNVVAHMLSEDQNGLFGYLGETLYAHVELASVISFSLFSGWLGSILFLVVQIGIEAYNQLRNHIETSNGQISNDVLLASLQIIFIVAVVVAIVSAGWFRTTNVHWAVSLLPSVFIFLVSFAVAFSVDRTSTGKK